MICFDEHPKIYTHLCVYRYTLGLFLFVNRKKVDMAEC
jgi:hypothetical protein